MNYIVNVSTQLRNSPKYCPEAQLILTHSSLLLCKLQYFLFGDFFLSQNAIIIMYGVH